MTERWLAVRVDLLGSDLTGDLWPPPGRVFAVGPHHTFADLAAAIDEAFARWDPFHLREVTLADGTVLADHDEVGPIEDMAERLVARDAAPGQAFRYVFDLGDVWVHRCTVLDEPVDPLELVRLAPDRPVPLEGWGEIPDQYGREVRDADLAGKAPLETDPMLDQNWPDLPARPEPVDVRELRGAVHRMDGPAIVAALEGRSWDSLPQLTGAGLLVALKSGTAGAPALAGSVVAVLHERAAPGDAELAAALQAVLDEKELSPPSLPVDIDALADLLEGDSSYGEGGYVDLRSGEVLPGPLADPTLTDHPVDVEDPARWLAVPCVGPREARRDMADFAATMPTRLRDRLESAIEGRGAFRRFRDHLDAAGESYVATWRAFSADRRAGRARAWLADHGRTAWPATARTN